MMEVKKILNEEYENFNEVKEFVYLQEHGIALIDDKDNETIYLKENIDNLFCIINQNNMNILEYIQDNFLLDETANDDIRGFVIMLNKKRYIIESL